MGPRLLFTGGADRWRDHEWRVRLGDDGDAAASGEHDDEAPVTGHAHLIARPQRLEWLGRLPSALTGELNPELA